MMRKARSAAMQTIHTPRLVLEPQVARHAAEMFVVLADPRIYEHENAPPASEQSLRARYARLETRCSADGREQWLNWVVRVRDGGAAVGYVQATVLPGGRALIGYEFGSAWWGRGLAHEATVAVVEELARTAGVTTVGAVFKRTNRRSRRLLQRLGMRPAHAGGFPATLAADDEDAMVRAARPPARLAPRGAD